MGSAALFFSLDPAKAVLSDINEDLINAFMAVQTHPRAVYNRLSKLPRGKLAYYRIRAEGLRGYSSLDRAARFIYLNRFSFNGIYRTNLKGQFNVPYCNNRNAYLPTLEDLLLASNALSRASIIASDFETVLQNQIKEGDFVYLDPPYAQDNKNVFHQYRPHEFGLDDLERLDDMLHRIDNKGATFLLSYGYCPEACEVFDRWPQKKIMVQRNIAGFVDARRRSAELLVTNA